MAKAASQRFRQWRKRPALIVLLCVAVFLFLGREQLAQLGARR